MRTFLLLRENLLFVFR
uniref:Uncharacterized protein n=1 Tax=Schistosoma mansoni TaxID=6183 RepID=A0AA82N7T0_SCHMA